MELLKIIIPFLLGLIGVPIVEIFKDFYLKKKSLKFLNCELNDINKDLDREIKKISNSLEGCRKIYTLLKTGTLAINKKYSIYIPKQPYSIFLENTLEQNYTSFSKDKRALLKAILSNIKHLQNYHIKLETEYNQHNSKKIETYSTYIINYQKYIYTLCCLSFQIDCYFKKFFELPSDKDAINEKLKKLEIELNFDQLVTKEPLEE